MVYLGGTGSSTNNSLLTIDLYDNTLSCNQGIFNINQNQTIMKNLLFVAALMLIVSCNSNPAESSQEETKAVERSIGFNTMLPDLKWHLGTEDAIGIVKDLDKKWAVKDYDAMKGFFADTAVCYFPDGVVAKSAYEFIAKIKSEDDGADVSWTFDYAFSVLMDVSTGD